MNTAKIQAEVNAFMKAHGSREVIEKYSRFFKEGYDPYGVPAEILFQYRKDFITKHETKLSLPEFLKLGGEFMASAKYEVKGMAHAIARRFADEIGRGHLAEMMTWFEHNHNNWAICDEFSADAFPVMLKGGKVEVRDFESWRSSSARWTRRVSIVSLIKPMKAEKKVKRYLEFAEPMMGEAERVVHQGIGWFLREAWKIETAPTEKLLLKYKNTAARLIYQTACEKMDQAGKERFRRDK